MSCLNYLISQHVLDANKTAVYVPGKDPSSEGILSPVHYDITKHWEKHREREREREQKRIKREKRKEKKGMLCFWIYRNGFKQVRTGIGHLCLPLSYSKKGLKYKKKTCEKNMWS